MLTPSISLIVKRITHLDDTLIEQLNQLFDSGTIWDKLQGQKFLAKSDNALFVAFLDKQAVGFVTCYRLQRFDKRQAEVLLYEIAVHQNYRQKGVGKLLIKQVKNWAHDVKAHEVWVLTDRANQAAVRLYTASGGQEDQAETLMFSFRV